MFEEKFLTFSIKTTANLGARPELGMDFKEGYDKEQMLAFSAFYAP